ncbi:protein-methionine-sulfoxide reductase catalytic subunit MsrP [Cycloclasticus sp. P1]|uniref:protein-methionine-sulfoxide reductase catalytic subunit MsrP n=1 Tax=Cycloclasticus sp. (strain P1) TaxID=385025 RepID=UPI000286AEBE|nr:protein-methionine-sulfoxide reductase catalytic subunit MsrP [Cycloclasticus sp. P1]AFT66489.1 molybdopterin binding Oxidoreductase, transmembrane protein [Cycloclasticus sp. P1]
MGIKKLTSLTDNDVTPKADFDKSRALISASRRQFLTRSSGFMVAGALAPDALWAGNKIENYVTSQFSLKEKLTPYEYVTGYNNFYEFGTAKSDPALRAHLLKTKPWSLTIEGEVAKPGVYNLEDILKQQQLEERIYRLRCVEAWSMVVPWIGFSLAELIRQMEPTSKAKYVEFTTLYDPKQMPGQKSRILKWPYVEGLRMDEAMNPLSLLATGLYGEEMPNQNGAPLRLIVPWKYGFKSIKSIVKIKFTEQMPKTSWNESAKNEYGFYANVNPDVPHPRWSQRRERVIGASLFTPKRDTELFNGYGEHVAYLYKGMNLRQFF